MRAGGSPPGGVSFGRLPSVRVEPSRTPAWPWRSRREGGRLCRACGSSGASVRTAPAETTAPTRKGHSFGARGHLATGVPQPREAGLKIAARLSFLRGGGGPPGTLSRKFASRADCCRILQRPADVRASTTLSRRTAEAVGVTSAISLGISPTPSTYATASRESRSVFAHPRRSRLGVLPYTGCIALGLSSST
jgi:hypothetical protein